MHILESTAKAGKHNEAFGGEEPKPQHTFQNVATVGLGAKKFEHLARGRRPLMESMLEKTTDSSNYELTSVLALTLFLISFIPISRAHFLAKHRCENAELTSVK